MTEDFNDFLAEKNGIVNDFTEPTLEILVRAMFKINREGEWHLIIDYDSVAIKKHPNDILHTNIYYSDHNNSEQEALQKALKYVYENSLNEV